MKTEHVMTVGGLKKLLEEFPDEMPIILAKDGEGNSYSPLAASGVGLDNYVEVTTWYGELIDLEELQDELENGWIDSMPEYTEVVVFWPVN